MKKINLIKFLIILFFISGCGYNPIFSNKDNNFSIYELSLSGNNKLNKIISGKLNNYKGSNNPKMFSIQLETNLIKEVASKDTKGNPTTYRINLKTDVIVKDGEGNIKNKLFYKSIDYNNKDNKSSLKKFENETSKNLAEKISDEIIIYLQSI
tara:strand:+ start:16 stop:474 length:459 start_codon:yes stop_codon:yes gene_type:complete